MAAAHVVVLPGHGRVGVRVRLTRSLHQSPRQLLYLADSGVGMEQSSPHKSEREEGGRGRRVKKQLQELCDLELVTLSFFCPNFLNRCSTSLKALMRDGIDKEKILGCSKLNYRGLGMRERDRT